MTGCTVVNAVRNGVGLGRIGQPLGLAMIIAVMTREHPLYLVAHISINIGGMMKTIGKCTYCKDPIYDFQKLEVEGNVIPLHKGCLAIVAEKVDSLIKH